MSKFKYAKTNFRKRNDFTHVEYLPSGNPPTFGDKIYVASFDPGIVSMGVRVESWNCNEGIVKAEYFGLIKCQENKNSFIEMMKQLDKEEIFDLCDMIIIEQQLKKIDELHSRYFQHIISYFLFRLKNKNCVIYEISSKLKSKHYPELQGLTKHGLKSKTIEVAVRILQERDDNWSVGVIRNCMIPGTGRKYFKGQTDLADSVVQIMAFFKELEIIN